MKDYLIVFGLFAALLIMQSIGGYLQIKNYREAIARMRPLGNVGIGQKKSFMNGGIVIIACDSMGVITGVEALEGQSIFSRFKKKDKLKSHDLIGENVNVLLEKLQKEELKNQKDNIAYIKALDALVTRLEGQETVIS